MQETMENWRKRLTDALRESGRSMREVSLEAGLSAAYLHTILALEQQPKYDNLLKVIDTLGVPRDHILLGHPTDTKEAIMLELWGELTADERIVVESFIRLLAKRAQRD